MGEWGGERVGEVVGVDGADLVEELEEVVGLEGRHTVEQFAEEDAEGEDVGRGGWGLASGLFGGHVGGGSGGTKVD